MAGEPESLKVEVSNNGAVNATLVTKPRDALFGDGGTTTSSTSVVVRYQEVSIDGQIFERDKVDRVFVSAIGPNLIVEADGVQHRYDASSHSLEDVEWLSYRVSAALNPRVSEAEASMDGLVVTLLALDPLVARNVSRIIHAALWGISLVPTSLAMSGGLDGNTTRLALFAILALWLFQVADLAFIGAIQAITSGPIPVHVEVGPTSLTVGSRSIPWSRITGVQLRDAQRLIRLATKDGTIDLNAPGGQAPRELDLAHRAIAAHVEDFHGGQAAQDERLAREAITDLKRGARDPEKDAQ